MSKRTDTIRSLFTQPQAALLSADNVEPESLRVHSGTVRSLKDSFSGIERENDALRARLAASASVIDIDAALIDPSPVTDRFSEADDASFQNLKTSIAANGQEIPVLLREHPANPGRFQSAYGHRRIRAARELGRPVRAIIRHLSDTELVVAQGIENSAREDLTFIERAVFAARLEAAGHGRNVVQEALSIDRAEASKLIAVAREIPADIVAAIGRAPAIGRGRWQALVEHCAAPVFLKRARAAAAASDFARLASDDRFLRVWACAARQDTQKAAQIQKVLTIKGPEGRTIAQARHSGRDVRLSLAPQIDPGFADFLLQELPALFQTYALRKGQGDATGA